MTSDPLSPILLRQGFVVVDGGLATELEWAGCDLDDPLWSARALLEAPERIAAVHDAYLEAGADVVTTASYQATFDGLAGRGLDEAAAGRLLAGSVDLARAARDRFWAEEANRAGRHRPLVAASIGPYGAALADGSEYRGDYDLDEDGLYAFHRRRLEVLAAAGPDLLACETIPCRVEVDALVRLLETTPEAPPAWLALTATAGGRLVSGEAIEPVVEVLDEVDPVVAIGVNCTHPDLIDDLIERLVRATSKPIVVYPNAGEAYSSEGRTWVAGSGVRDLSARVVDWYRRGARVVGGCCRTRPADIHAMRLRLTDHLGDYFHWRGPRTPYFPERAFGDDRDLDRFVRNWYSRALQAAGEPSIYARPAGDRRVYRLLVLPTDGPPSVVRVEVSGGAVVLERRRLGGRGGHDLGTLVESERRDLPAADGDDLERAVEAAGLIDLPTEEPAAAGRVGDRWILEIDDGSEYHVVDRPVALAEAGLARVVEALLALGRAGR